MYILHIGTRVCACVSTICGSSRITFTISLTTDCLAAQLSSRDQQKKKSLTKRKKESFGYSNAHCSRILLNKICNHATIPIHFFFNFHLLRAIMHTVHIECIEVTFIFRQCNTIILNIFSFILTTGGDCTTIRLKPRPYLDDQ